MDGQRRSLLVDGKRPSYYPLETEDDTVGLNAKDRPIPTLASNVLAFVCKGFVEVRGQSFTGFFTCFAAR